MSNEVASSNFKEVLGPDGFAACFGVRTGELPARCKALVAQYDLSYTTLQGEDRDRVILDVLRRLEADTQKIGAAERTGVWERGWRETLNEYVRSDYAPSALVPKFIRPNQAVRLNRQFILPADSNFELRFVEVLREWLFPKFFSEFDQVHEFGSGTGFNLVTLASIFPEKRLFGSDFVPAPVELLNKIASHLKINATARLFDMTNPPADYELAAGSAIFTFGAIEQLASKFDRFVDFLLERRPGICLHVEPTVELYDENNLVDHLAIRFHRKRGYTEGFLPRLQKLAAERKIELIATKRLNFGSLMMEGYNLIVWRPIG